jgi:hypothetical protein
MALLAIITVAAKRDIRTAVKSNLERWVRFRSILNPSAESKRVVVIAKASRIRFSFEVACVRCEYITPIVATRVIASCPDSVTLPRKREGITPGSAASKNECRDAIDWPAISARHADFASALEAKSGIVRAKNRSELRALKLRPGEMPKAADNIAKRRNSSSGAMILLFFLKVSEVIKLVRSL